MFEFIATITLIGSLTGIAVILYRKLPELRKMSEPKKGRSLEEKIKIFWLKIKSLKPFQQGFFNNFLQKTLSKTKVLAIKVENKCSHCLQEMREKSIKREKAKNDTYWQKLKKSLKRKKSLKKKLSKKKKK